VFEEQKVRQRAFALSWTCAGFLEQPSVPRRRLDGCSRRTMALAAAGSFYRGTLDESVVCVCCEARGYCRFPVDSTSWACLYLSSLSHTHTITRGKKWYDNIILPRRKTFDYIYIDNPSTMLHMWQGHWR